MLSLRITSAVVGLLTLYITLKIGGIFLASMVFLVSVIAYQEFCKVVENKGIKCFRIMSFLFLVFLIFSVYYYGSTFYALIIVCSFVVFFAVHVFKFKETNFINLVVSFFGFVYVSLFSFIILIYLMNKGVYYLWLIFIIVWASDTFAYFVGIRFGKKPLAPKLSPKKSVEGSLGGIAGGITLSIAYGCFVFKGELPVAHLFGLGLILGSISQMGDLAASTIKRFAGVKDYGEILPGHGGILDRFDSVLFTLPVAYYYLKLVVN